MNKVRLVEKTGKVAAAGKCVNSTQHRTIQINQAGLIDISTGETSLLMDDRHIEHVLNALTDDGKRRLYKGLLKKISNCLNQSSRLLKEKCSLANSNDGKEARRIYRQYKMIVHQERLLWKQVKVLYDMLNAHHT